MAYIESLEQGKARVVAQIGLPEFNKRLLEIMKTQELTMAEATKVVIRMVFEETKLFGKSQ
jgi:hypothetical protein